MIVIVKKWRESYDDSGLCKSMTVELEDGTMIGEGGIDGDGDVDTGWTEGDNEILGHTAGDHHKFLEIAIKKGEGKHDIPIQKALDLRY